MTAVAQALPVVDLEKPRPALSDPPRLSTAGFDAWTLRRRLAVLLISFGLVVGIGLTVASAQVRGVSRQQQYQVTHLAPAINAVTALRVGLVDEETGLRGYALVKDSVFLQPYQAAIPAVEQARATLLETAGPAGDIRAAIAGLDTAITAWQQGEVAPLLAAVQAGQTPSDQLLTTGKTLFDAIRVQEDAVSTAIDAVRLSVRNALQDDIHNLEITIAALAVIVLLVMILVWFMLRSWITDPLEALGREVRIVSRGQLDHQVTASGAAEVRTLGADVEVMRARIAGEIEISLDREARLRRSSTDIRIRNDDLARSNAELEQFAYVASHDLQEPLRKIASFCQLLERRYADALDDTGRKYIAFAVDGSKRMQVIINDLLTFSRTGRTTDAFVPVDLGDAAATALGAVDTAVKAADARVDLPGAWPVVPGQAGLLVLLLQNLFANALKFRRPDVPPHVVVDVVETVVDDRPMVRVGVTDNGIGIDPQFAEKVFALFQRLHARDAYEGTGIGLALCRKVVEFHGGRIWIDADHDGPGTRIVFTLGLTTPEQ